MNLLLIFILLVRSVLSINCPPYCECYENNGRYVGCVGKGLISLDLNIPQSVQWLSLTNNYIDNLYKDIFHRYHLYDLQVLDIDKNNLNNIDQYAFRGMDYLNRVNLSSNHLYRIHPMTFEHSMNLLNLDLSSNPLRSLPQPFLISSSLQVLSIRACHLGFLPIHSLSKLPSLSNLNIMDNQIIQISPDFLREIPRLTHLYIRGNNLHCETESYYTFMAEVKARHISLYGTNCPISHEAMTRSKPSRNNHIKSNTTSEKFQRMVIHSKTTTKPVTAKDFKLIEPSSSTTQKIQVEKPQKKMFTVWVVLIVLISGLVLGIIITFIFLAVYALYKRCKWWLARSRTRTTNSNSQFLPNAQTLQASQIPLVFKPTAPSSANIYAPPPTYSQLFRS